MHRRARHLNPASAGMGLVLDSRFITGLNAGDTVSNWKDRSSNANNATGATNLPTYQTNRQGGAPAVVFNSATSTRLACSTSVYTGANSRTLICVYKSTATGSYVNGVGGQSGTATTGAWFVMQSRTTTVTGDPYIAGFSADTQDNKSTPDNQFKVGSGIYNGTTLLTRKNGVEIDSIARSMNTNNSVFRVGATDNGGTLGEFFLGDIAFITAGQIPYSLSLVKRLEQSAALSFKLPCS